MLNTLPKFELVPISRYFIMLPEARRPARIPRWSTRRLRSPRITSAASRATSAAPIDGNADVGGMQRRRIVDPVTHEPDDVAAMLEREDDPVLLRRRHAREDRALFRHVPKRRRRPIARCRRR